MESSPKGKNFDRRMTGASVIDEALHEVREVTVIIHVNRVLQIHVIKSGT